MRLLDVLNYSILDILHVRWEDGVNKRPSSWGRGAEAGRARRFSAGNRHCFPAESSPRCTNTWSRRRTRPCPPAVQSPPAPSWGAAWGSRLAAGLGSGRCWRCRRHWAAGRTPGSEGIRPPFLCSGWTRHCPPGRAKTSLCVSYDKRCFRRRVLSERTIVENRAFIDPNMGCKCFPSVGLWLSNLTKILFPSLGFLSVIMMDLDKPMNNQRGVCVSCWQHLLIWMCQYVPFYPKHPAVWRIIDAVSALQKVFQNSVGHLKIKTRTGILKRTGNPW